MEERNVGKDEEGKKKREKGTTNRNKMKENNVSSKDVRTTPQSQSLSCLLIICCAFDRN
jgi:hypothetical protein